MFRRILLGVLCVQFVISAETDAAVENVRVESDNFMPYTANPIKDLFDWKLLQQFTSAKGYKNVILSPLSLKLVMVLLYEGAEGLTKKEFRNVLNFPENKTLIRKEYSDLLNILTAKGESHDISIGSQLFLDSRLSPLPTYQAQAHEFYKTTIAKTNFSNPLEASRAINDWVDNLTNGRIKSFVNPDNIANAVLLAANAIYFKGMWSIPFPQKDSFEAGFYASGNEVVQVQYMKQTDTFYYSESNTLNAQILRIPYKGNKFALYIILPNSRNGLSYIINDLNTRAITLGVRLMDSKPVTVILPKFKFEFQTSYSRILREFGFDTLFTGIASFPGIVRDQEAQLVVTDILQKSGIDVDEEGSVVYTTTQVTIGNKFGGDQISLFNASRPFLFFVQEEDNNNIVFIGKIENPLDNNSTPVELRYGEGNSSIPAVPLTTPNQFSPPILQNSKFDLDILKNSIGTAKNVFLSPASVKVSLAMLAEGAVGPTADQIYRTLQIPSPQKDFAGSLINELNQVQPRSRLEFQNALFVSDKERIKAQYEATVAEYYQARIKQLNYQNKEKAASVINTFINNATGGLIPTIISADEIDPSTKVILTNALYFNANWATVFDKKWTRESCFKTANGCVTVQLMQLIDNFRYLKTQNAQIVQINYAGDTRAMLLVVPKERNGLSAALDDMELYGSFSRLVWSLNITEVDLVMPRFDIAYNVDLIAILQKMGIRDVFDTNANLSNFLEGGNSDMVDSFIHKAKIEVNEEGTKASAVSLISVIPLMGTSTPKVRADHPFAFFIFNTATNTILFEGILSEPQSSINLEAKIGNIHTDPQRVNDQSATQLQDEEYRRMIRY